MATKKSSPSNQVMGRRPLDSIDSLRPSSLPPELGSLDMRWDDDPRSVGTIDLLKNADLDLDVDAGERTTAVPEIPIHQLVEKTMAEADAREIAQQAQWSPNTDYRHTEPTVTNEYGPQYAGELQDRLATQPAPRRHSPAHERSEATPIQSDATGGWSQPREPSERPAQDLQAQGCSGGPTGSVRSLDASSPNSSRPGIALDQRFTAPPLTRRADVDGLRHQMKDLYATGDFSGALQLAETLLDADSGDLDAQRFATSCRDVLTQMFTSRIGSLDQVVEVILSQEELRWLTLDHRAGFFLSLVDGLLTIEELLDISGMARLASLRILSTLIDQRVLRLVSH